MVGVAIVGYGDIMSVFLDDKEGLQRFCSRLRSVG